MNNIKHVTPIEYQRLLKWCGGFAGANNVINSIKEHRAKIAIKLAIKQRSMAIRAAMHRDKQQMQQFKIHLGIISLLCFFGCLLFL